MEVLHEKYPYRYVENGIIELNGEPDYRIQKYNTYSMRSVSYTHLTLPTSDLV